MPRTRWPIERVARAAFLCGKGYPADRIAADPLIGSQASAVERHLRNVGMVPRECANDDALLSVPSPTVAALGTMARKRGESAEEMAARLLSILAAESTLAANVLDD